MPLSRGWRNTAEDARSEGHGDVNPPERFFPREAPPGFSDCYAVCSAHSNLHPRKANKTGEVGR